MNWFFGGWKGELVLFVDVLPVTYVLDKYRLSLVEQKRDYPVVADPELELVKALEPLEMPCRVRESCLKFLDNPLGRFLLHFA